MLSIKDELNLPDAYEKDVFIIQVTKPRNRIFPLNPFSSNVPLLYSLKTAENRRFPVSTGYGSGILGENGLIMLIFS